MKLIPTAVLALLFLFSASADALAPNQFVIDDSQFHPVVIKDEKFSPIPNPTQIEVVQPTPIVITLTPTDPKEYALSRVGSVQFRCLDKLWTRESRWNPLALNKSSGAYGIPQAVPGSKMATAGSDWRTNPITQVRWGLLYIKQRYGTPCVAWNHSQVYGWY